MIRRPLQAVVAALLVATVGITFLPWVGIGRSRRSSYQLLTDLDTLGVLHGPVAFAGRLVWVCQPALACLALLLAVLGRLRWAALVTLAGFVITGAGAVVVQRAPVQALVGARMALPTALLGIVCLAGLLVAPLQGRSRRRQPA
ncbi:MAG: hypothetical protein ACKV2O_04660 [Acidimicrobiales bacterium]